MADNDSLGDRMKELEAHETARCFLPGLPVYVRCDGKTFSKFTKGMRRPFDERVNYPSLKGGAWKKRCSPHLTNQDAKRLTSRSLTN